MIEEKPLNIFVAMPGTNMGDAASWKNVEQIKEHFFTEIVNRLRTRITNPINDVIIEKDKVTPGLIHLSMFREAWDADVYIADLTGNNPNVYLELGVRWAVKDNITIIVSQNVGDIKFNAAANRAILYNNDPGTLKNSIEQVVQAIVVGLQKNNNVDSPVRVNNLLIAVERAEIEEKEKKIVVLEERIRHLESERGLDYLSLGQATNNPDLRIEMFEKAIEANKLLWDAYLCLGVELRSIGRNDDAIKVLQVGLSLKPDHATLYRELGITYTKEKELHAAAEALSNAVKYDEDDIEAWSSFGGVLRRLSFQKAIPCDWSLLRRARDCYEEARKRNKNDHYSLGNIARLNLLLSSIESEQFKVAQDEFDTLKWLCRFQLKDNPQDCWLKFDLADSYLLSGDIATGLELYEDAIKSVPPSYQKSILSSVISPLEELLVINVLENNASQTIKNLVLKMEKIITD